MKLFVDRTGQPGPSTWELGDYPEGQDDYPVSGLSWYEAAAYAEFKGKSYPRFFTGPCGFSTSETCRNLSPPYSAEQSEGTEPTQVGKYPGIGSSGAKDMAGNVREWC